MFDAQNDEQRLRALRRIRRRLRRLPQNVLLELADELDELAADGGLDPTAAAVSVCGAVLARNGSARGPCDRRKPGSRLAGVGLEPTISRL